MTGIFQSPILWTSFYQLVTAESYFVYIIETVDRTYYTGQTNDLVRRLEEHLSGGSKSAAYFRMHRPQYLVYTEECESRAAAMQREREIKRNRRLKLNLIGKRQDIQAVIDTLSDEEE